MANETPVDARKIGVGPKTLSELAAVRQLYKPYPRAEQSFSFEEAWTNTTHLAEISRSPIDGNPMENSPTVSTDYNYQDGDIVMMSSDNVSFRVDSILLRRASSVPYTFNLIDMMLIYIQQTCPFKPT